MKVNLDLIVKAVWEGKGIDDGDKQLQSFTKGFDHLKLAGSAALVALSAAVLKFGVDSLNVFTDFEKGMNEVFTLLPGISSEAMGAMKDDVLDFAQEAGRLPSEVVPAIYQAISAGVPQSNVFEFMKVASDAALGGVTDLETAVDGITSVVNSYGEEAVNAQQASDLMFTAVKLGKTNFEELSRYMFQVTPVASALGVDFGNVTAALAALTAQGTPTRVAATQIRAALVELSKSGSETDLLFRELAGKGFKEFIAEGNTLQDALKLLENYAKQTGVGINDLFGSVEAGNAVLGLTGRGTEAFTNALLEMENAAGATAEAAETMAESLAFVEAQSAAATEALKVQVGEALEPLKRSWLEAKLAAVDYLSESVSVRDQTLATSAALEELGFTGVSLQKTIGAVGDGTILWRESMVGAEEMARRTTIAVGLLENGHSRVASELNDSINRITEYNDHLIEAGQTTGAYTESLDDLRRASIEAAQAQEELKEQALLDHLRQATDGAGELSGAQAMLNDETAAVGVETGVYAKHLEEVAEAERAAAAAAREHAAAMGDYFTAAITATDGIGFYNETAAEMADRTIYVSNLTGEQRTALESLQAEYAKAQSTVAEYTMGAKGVGLTAEQVAEKVGEQQERMAELEAAMQPLIAAGGEFVDIQGQASINQGAVNQAIYDAADASDASAVQLALLGSSLGLYSDEAANAALKSALIQEKIDQLAQSYVAGDISVGQMREELNLFIADVGGMADDMLGAAESTESLTGSAGSLGIALGEVTGAAAAATDALNGIPTEIPVHVSVTTDPVPTFPTGPGSGQPNRDQAFSSGGYTGGMRGQPVGTVHGEEYVFDAQAVDAIGLGNLQDAHRTGRLPAGGGGMVVNLHIDARGAAPGVGREVAAAGEVLSQRFGREINKIKRGG